MPVYQSTAASTFWNRPMMGFTDRTAPPGTLLSYRVWAEDPFGNSVSNAATAVTVSADTRSAPDGYEQAVLADAPRSFWRLGEAAGATSYDHAGYRDLSLGAGVGLGRPGALVGRTNPAASFTGTSTGVAATQAAVPGPNVFSLEAWFSTTSTVGGKLIGFGDQKTGLSGSFDRHVNLDAAGRVTFGVYNNQLSSVQSGPGFNDGRWHHMVATLGPGGMALHLDGKPVAQRADVTFGAPYTGFWRIGGDQSWNGATPYLRAAIDEVAVYPTVLAPAAVARHHAAGTTAPPPNAPPTASFSSSVSGLAAAVDASGSTDPEGPVASYGWTFGDGSTGTGVTASHSYTAAGSYPVRLTVTDAAGATATLSRTVTVAAPPPPPPGSPLAADAFGREVAGGLGTADAGGPWSISGAASGAAVTGGAGTLTVAPAGSLAAQLTVSAQDVAVQADIGLAQPPTGGGTFLRLATRHVGTTRYETKLWFAATGRVQLSVASVVANVETVLSTVTLPAGYLVGDVLTVRFQTSGTGSTALRAKAWTAGTTEPVAWQVSATDTAPELQRPGGLRAHTYLSASATGPQTVRLDNFWAGAAGSTPTAP